MKKLLGLGMCAMVLGGIAAETQLIAEWDFTTGKTASRDGRFVGKLRGTTAIAGSGTEKFLAVGMQESSKPEGLIMNRVYPELSPRGAFTLEAEVSVREPSGPQPYLMIWDNKYGIHTDSNVRGFMFYLARIKDKDDEFVPVLWLGMGQSHVFFNGKPIKLQFDKKYSIAVEYDGIDQATFLLDKVPLNTVKARRFNMKNAKGEVSLGEEQTGAMAPAVFPAAIGDRYNDTFSHFDGNIYKLRLYGQTAAPAEDKQ